MRDRVTISLNSLPTTRLTRLSKRKPCSSCAYLLVPHRVWSGKKSRIVFAIVNILFTSGRVRNRFTTRSRDAIGCERVPEFGVLFTFLYLLLYLYWGSFFTKYLDDLDKNGIIRLKSAFCSRSCSELSLLFRGSFLPKSLTNQPLRFTLLSVCRCPLCREQRSLFPTDNLSSRKEYLASLGCKRSKEWWAVPTLLPSLQL